MHSIWPEDICYSSQALNILGTECVCVCIYVVDNDGVDAYRRHETSELGGPGKIRRDCAPFKEDTSAGISSLYAAILTQVRDDPFVFAQVVQVPYCPIGLPTSEQRQG